MVIWNPEKVTICIKDQGLKKKEAYFQFIMISYPSWAIVDNHSLSTLSCFKEVPRYIYIYTHTHTHTKWYDFVETIT